MRGGISARDLHGAFVRLGAGIAEEHLIHPGAGAENLRQLGTGGSVIEVGGVLEKLRLVRDSLRPHGIGIAEGIDADTGGHVDIGLAVIVIADRALTGGDRDIKAFIGMRYVALISLFNAHCFSFKAEGDL